MHVIAHSSTHAPSSASSAALRGAEVRPREIFGRVGERHLAVAREVAHDRVVLGRAHVPGREHGVVIAGRARAPRWSRAGARRRRRSPRYPGPGRPSWAADTAVEVLLARERRQPHDARAEVAARPRPRPGSCPPTSRSQQMPPNTAMPGTDLTPTDHASDAVGKSCDFSTMARWPAAAASRAASNASTDRSRCGVGTEVTVQVGGPAQDRRSSALGTY